MVLTTHDIYKGVKVKLRPEKITGIVTRVEQNAFVIHWDDNVDSMYEFEDLPLSHVSLCEKHYVAGQQKLFDNY